MPSHTRPITCALGLAAAAACATVLVAGPSAAAPASSAPTAADATFAQSNEQGNLAEIALGTLASKKGQDAATLNIARMTKSDHVTARTKLTAVASAAKVSLPSTPNAVQLTVASQLTAAPAKSFDLMYAQAQVTAHQQALAAARTEESTTKNAAFKTYTAYYIGIATMHLQMAQAEVSALGGTPNTVAAGSGGAAATNSSGDNVAAWAAVGGGAVLLVAGAGLTLRRRRPTVTG